MKYVSIKRPLPGILTSREVYRLRQLGRKQNRGSTLLRYRARTNSLGSERYADQGASGLFLRLTIESARFTQDWNSVSHNKYLFDKNKNKSTFDARSVINEATDFVVKSIETLIQLSDRFSETAIVSNDPTEWKVTSEYPVVHQ